MNNSTRQPKTTPITDDYDISNTVLGLGINGKLIVCAVAAVACGVEYPPGIHPAVCPNYPYCDMEVLARHTPQGIPIPEWELPYARMMPAAVPVPAVFGIPKAVEYPADVDPASCPNYPYCT